MNLLYVKLLMVSMLTGIDKIVGLKEFRKVTNPTNYNDYLRQTGQFYSDQQEYTFRSCLYDDTKKLVDDANQKADQGQSSYRLEINPLADKTKEEKSRLTGSKLSHLGEGITARHENYVEMPLPDGNLPQSFDWRLLGGVTPARFQGFDCGSCWSFATIAALEGHLFRRTGFLVPLSEQNLIDCSEQYGSEGCDGGFQEYAYEYIRDHGITLAKKYPYMEVQNQQCLINVTANGSIIRIRSYAIIKPGDEQRMKQIIATLGPLSCSMNGSPDSFAQYSGGVYDDNECNQDEVNHSVAVVGYGSENGKDFWIIKNSYSENWGEKGFMRLARNRNSFCGIADECSYPEL